jgi:hypothetical protein
VVGTLRDHIGNPVFQGDRFTRDAQIEVHAEQDHDHQRKAGPDDDLRLAVFFFQLAEGRQHDRTGRTQRRSGRRVGDAAQDRAKHGHDQNQRREHNAQQLVLRQPSHRLPHAVEREQCRDRQGS